MTCPDSSSRRKRSSRGRRPPLQQASEDRRNQESAGGSLGWLLSCATSQASLDMLKLLDPLVKEPSHDGLKFYVGAATKRIDQPFSSALEFAHIRRRHCSHKGRDVLACTVLDSLRCNLAADKIAGHH